MEAWHNAKINKYMPLKSVIENNSYSVDLFAVEFGARGYCSQSVLRCFKSLSSIEFSFYIWLARNNKACSTKEINLSLKTPEDPLVHQNPLSTRSKASSLKINSPLPVGFINKGNNSYTNAILQTLSVLPSLWNRGPSESPSLSPLLKSITLKMKIKSRSKKPIDASEFHHTPFNFNSQQDAAEVQQFVIDELKGTSMAVT